MFQDRIKELLAIQGKCSNTWNISIAEAHGLLNDIPRWDSTQSVEEEIFVRFSRGDRADLDARMNQCRQFDQLWDGPRTEFSNRLNSILILFDEKVDEAV